MFRVRLYQTVSLLVIKKEMKIGHLAEAIVRFASAHMYSEEAFRLTKKIRSAYLRCV
jgi:hypothetical protein